MNKKDLIFWITFLFLIFFIILVLLVSASAVEIPQNITWTQKLDICDILNVSVPACVIGWESFGEGNLTETIYVNVTEYVNQTVYVNVTFNSSDGDDYGSELAKITAYKDAGLVPLWKDGVLVGFENPEDSETVSAEGLMEDSLVTFSQEDLDREVAIALAGIPPFSDDSSDNNSSLYFILVSFIFLVLVIIFFWIKQRRFSKPSPVFSPSQGFGGSLPVLPKPDSSYSVGLDEGKGVPEY